jgi:hypothetical protein
VRSAEEQIILQIFAIEVVLIDSRLCTDRNNWVLKLPTAGRYFSPFDEIE